MFDTVEAERRPRLERLAGVCRVFGRAGWTRADVQEALFEQARIPAWKFEKLIGEVLAPLDDFPRQLWLPDQGRFALGYYHQRQAFYTRKSDTPAADKPTTQED